jgi:hypothetical protein
MKRNCLLLFALLAFAGLVPGGTYFYTVYFDSPINQTGQPPVVGRPWGQVPCDIEFGEPLVESAFGHLQHQPLVFTAMGYQTIEFCLGERAPDYFVDFDFESRNLNGSKFTFTLLFDTPTVQDFYLHGLGYIGVPPANSRYLPGWTDGELHHMHIDVNLTNATWTLQLDHGTAFTGPFHSDTGDVQSLRMDLSTWYGGTPDNTNVQIAIDNVLIGTGIFPPPPTISCPGTLDLECTNAASSTLQAYVLDTSGSPLTIVWTVDGTAVQTNLIAPNGNFTETNLSLVLGMGTGQHLVLVSASNGQGAPANCATAVGLSR